jgi:hypothetical protein
MVINQRGKSLDQNDDARRLRALPSRDSESALTAVTSWDPPGWAECSVTDEDSVIHRRQVGEIDPVDGGPTLRIDVVQRDSVVVAAGPAGIERSPAQVSLTGELLSPPEARELAEFLDTAADVLERDASTAALRLRRLLSAS